MTAFKAKIIEYEGKRRIAVEFANKLELINRFKKLPGRKWSSSLKVWHLPDNKVYRKQFGIPIYDKDTLSEEKIGQLMKFKDWLTAHRYSKSTENTYMNVMRVFLVFYKDKPITEIENDDIVLFDNVSYNYS